MASWRRAGQWSLRLPCAAPRRHAVWGRLSSEGLDLTFGPPCACVTGPKDAMAPAERRGEASLRRELAHSRRRGHPGRSVPTLARRRARRTGSATLPAAQSLPVRATARGPPQLLHAPAAAPFGLERLAPLSRPRPARPDLPGTGLQLDVQASGPWLRSQAVRWLACAGRAAVLDELTVQLPPECHRRLSVRSNVRAEATREAWHPWAAQDNGACDCPARPKGGTPRGVASRARG
jgi:hypothetical protein